MQKVIARWSSTNLWWLCALAGITLIGVEILSPGFSIIWLGFAALITAIPVAVDAPVWVDLLTFTVALLLLITLGRKRIIGLLWGPGRGTRTNAEGAIGRTGVVVERVDPVAGTGKVRVDSEIWSASSRDGVCIEIGRGVRVHSLAGVRLIVSEEAGK